MVLGHGDIVDTGGDGDKVRRRAATSKYSHTHFIFTAVDVVLSASFLQRLTMTIAIALILGARDHSLIFVSQIQDWDVLFGRAWNEDYPKVREDFIITEKAPTRAFFCLKAPTNAFTFKTLLDTILNGHSRSRTFA